MRVRDFQPTDLGAIATLFYETVRFVNRADYAQEQVEAWAPRILATSFWGQRLAQKDVLVVEDDHAALTAFATLESTGYIDFFFCRHDLVGQGVGTLLYQELEARARQGSIVRLFTQASLTARPFFERRGFHSIRSQQVEIRGVKLRNDVMEKHLS